MLVAVSALNGILLPILLVFLMILINDHRLVGELKNGPIYNVLGWGTVVFVTLAVIALLGSEALGWLGIDVFQLLGAG